MEREFPSAVFLTWTCSRNMIELHDPVKRSINKNIECTMLVPGVAIRALMATGPGNSIDKLFAGFWASWAHGVVTGKLSSPSGLSQQRSVLDRAERSLSHLA